MDKVENIYKLFVLFLIPILLFSGCGGGGGSSSSDETSISNVPPPTNNNTSSTPANVLSNFIDINPLRDLGLSKGEQVCFRLKSYNNVATSKFSKPICSKVKNEQYLTLTWETVSDKINGYYVYFGTNKNKADDNFLADVIES